jgi:alkanesulfonate monooxygenase SsuD/methylene tetrahydromethanopterin reductase-like flavin-dependent oxidoreductase (luciferase family)
MATTRSSTIALVKLGFGLVTCQRTPADERSDADLYHEAIELSVEAERLGFDSVWLTEHHFVDDGYMPSLMAVAAAIAVRTERIQIGTGLVLAPLHDPIRLAEDAATVDLLSHGRLLLGLGMGWRREEFEGLGIPISERRTRLLDCVAVLRQSWGDGLVTGTRRRPYPGVSVRPKPFRPGGPPIWIGAVAEPAVRRAGRIGDGYMSGDIGPDGFAEQLAWAREELTARAAPPQGFAVSLYQATFAWEQDDAWPLVRDSLHYLNWKYEDMDEAFGRAGAPAPPPRLSAEAEAALREHALVGTPQQVAAGIRRYAEVAGDDLHFVAQLYWPGMPYDRQLEAMRVFAERVAPLLRG